MRVVGLSFELVYYSCLCTMVPTQLLCEVILILLGIILIYSVI